MNKFDETPPRRYAVKVTYKKDEEVKFISDMEKYGYYSRLASDDRPVKEKLESKDGLLIHRLRHNLDPKLSKAQLFRYKESALLEIKLYMKDMFECERLSEIGRIELLSIRPIAHKEIYDIVNQYDIPSEENVK